MLRSNAHYQRVRVQVKRWKAQVQVSQVQRMSQKKIRLKLPVQQVVQKFQAIKLLIENEYIKK